MNTQVKVNHIETVHTYAQWERIHNTRKQAKRENAIYFLKQKLAGLIVLLIGIITPVVCDGDATFSIIAIPMGIGLLVTKQKVMMFRGYEKE